MHHPDIQPKTPISIFDRELDQDILLYEFDENLVSALVGMSTKFLRKVLNKRKGAVRLEDILLLLDQDAFSETFVPRSKIIQYLRSIYKKEEEVEVDLNSGQNIFVGCALDLIQQLPAKSINCVVTSTPYWGTRLYDEPQFVQWADGELCVFGHEQTPEAFIRHSIEILYHLKRTLKDDASVWWNIMDTYNTRTQIRGNASEALNAMKGNDKRKWSDHACRRYSAGHSYLEDGEQCLIPSRIAERASRIGYLVKSTITWKKNGSMPETVASRVTRELEVIIHLSLQRTPYFDKNAFNELPTVLGGRNTGYESEKVTDVWFFSTASGTKGHGAQFPIALPARCIALSTKTNDIVLDPFLGGGTTAIAANKLTRRCVGFEISQKYADIATKQIEKITSQKELF
jgi:DNA modification methylase